MTDFARFAALEARLAAAEGRLAITEGRLAVLEGPPASGGFAGPLTGPVPMPMPKQPTFGPWDQVCRKEDLP